MIREAEDRLNELAGDEVTRRLYEMREKALHDRANCKAAVTLLASTVASKII